jgi:hypothetical protein
LAGEIERETPKSVLLWKSGSTVDGSAIGSMAADAGRKMPP